MLLKLYKPRNVASVSAHYIAAGAVLGGVALVASPWVLGASAVLLGLGQAAGIAVAKNLYEKKLQRHDDAYEYSPRLGETVKELYAKAGMKQDDCPIYDFKVDESKVKGTVEEKKTAGKIFEKIGQMHNAGAIFFGKPIILVSKPLLKLLDDAEEKAVIAHEFAHAAARHHYMKTPVSYALGVAGLSMGLTVLGALFATGFWVGIGAMVGTGVLAAVTGAKLGKALPEEKHKKTVKTATGVVSGGALLTVGSFIHPAFPFLYAINLATKYAGKVINARLSRSNEFQADRGAVELGADPLAMITALRKITIVHDRAKAAAGMPKKGALTEAWTKATATHPALDRRIARLSKLATKQNRPAADIEAAVKGPIHVDAVHDMSPEVLKQMMRVL